jgi:hypothetical protein
MTFAGGGGMNLLWFWLSGSHKKAMEILETRNGRVVYVSRISGNPRTSGLPAEEPLMVVVRCVDHGTVVFFNFLEQGCEGGKRSVYIPS